ncbi:MAG: hypothetical protein FJW66_04290 [Actinobacteria bacterium]|nr:hypothetical protein [Actinomycetota bacterium]
MFYAKVIGKTYSSFKHKALDGINIKIIQDVDVERRVLTGKPFLALDAIGVAIGEFVGYEVSTQATWPFQDILVPTDATITAIIDSINI